MILTFFQQQYLINWYNGFVNYIGSLLSVVMALMASPEANEEDKRALDIIKGILNSQDAADIERDLAAGVVRKSTLDKIAKLNKDLADTCIEHIPNNPLVREFLKQMVHIKIERDKAGEQERLAALQIPVRES